VLRWLRRRDRGRRPPAVEWRPVAWARHQPEAEMLADILRQYGIPVYFRRAGGVDLPDYLAGGARVLLVPSDRLLEAHALLDPHEPIAPEDDGDAEGDGH
jgi:hypothetical protein